MRISDWSSDVCSSDLGLCQRHFAALAPHSGGKVGDSNGAVKAMKLDDPVDQRSRSGCAKQFVAQGPEVAAGIVAQQLVELLPHALDARPEFAANRLRVFSGRAGANTVGGVQPNAGRGGVDQRK